MMRQWKAITRHAPEPLQTKPVGAAIVFLLTCGAALLSSPQAHAAMNF